MRYGPRVSIDGLLVNQCSRTVQMAILGPSGAGKSTLLDCLARVKNTGVVEGRVLVNGHELDDDRFKRLSGYVYQDDRLMGLLTVRGPGHATWARDSPPSPPPLPTRVFHRDCSHGIPVHVARCPRRCGTRHSCASPA